jgi:hypothetical protein
MFEGLESIDWKNLIHEDIPIWIRGLASQDERTRKASYDKLYDHHIFDGSIHYIGTPYIVPFLTELLKDKNTQEKDSILLMLVQLLDAAISTLKVNQNDLTAKTIFENIKKDISLYKTFLQMGDDITANNAKLLLGYIEE